jgi:hypothetical protein
MSVRDNIDDKRKFSGNRVLAECELVLKRINPFSHFNNVKSGLVVLNIRGGCLYLPERYAEQSIERIFPDRKIAMIEKLTLSDNDCPRIIFKNIKISFQRLRKEKNREGIVFRFSDVSDDQLEKLEKLKDNFPAISANEESSVPFEEIITLNKDHGFELL